MLYGFVEDTLYNNPDVDEIPPVGYYLPDIDSLFVDKKIFEDTRPVRLQIPYRDESFTLTQFLDDLIWEIYKKVLIYHNIDPITDNTGIIEILYNYTIDVCNQNQSYAGSYFQANRSCYMKLYYDNNILTDDDKNYIASMTQQEINAIFNIIEYCANGIIMGDTLEDIDNYLRSDTTKFLFYSPGSIQVSNNRRLAKLFCNVNIYRLVPEWIQFTLEKSGGYLLTIKVWLDQYKFLSEYIKTVTVDVIPPTDLETLLNLSTLQDIYAALYEARETTYEHLSNILNTNQYIKVKNFNVLYEKNNINKEVTFLILYKGIEPDYNQCVQIVRDYLLNSGVGNEDTWREIFPSLFTTDIIYLFPIWDEVYALPTKTLYRSVIKDSKINNVYNVIKQYVFNNSTIPENIYEVLQTAYMEGFVIATYNINNKNYFYLTDKYPDFQRYTPTDPNYTLYKPDTQDFISKYNRAIGQASGEINDDFSEITINNFKFVTFYSGGVTYFILTKEAYENIFS